MSNLLEYCRLREREVQEAESRHDLEEVLKEVPAKFLLELDRAEPGYTGPYWESTGIRQCQRDELLRELCHFHQAAPEVLQLVLRACVSELAGRDLLFFAFRSAVFALRGGGAAALEDGFLAIALENLAFGDPRDDIWTLSRLVFVAEHLELESRNLLELAVDCSGPPLRALLNDYFLAPLEGAQAGFSCRVVETPEGLSLVGN